MLDGPAGGAVNMATDMRLFEEYLSHERGPSLRLYRWLEPTVTLGRHQDPSTLPASLRSKDISVLVRPTGGQAVLHSTSELTYSVIAGERDGFPSGAKAAVSSIVELIRDSLAEIRVSSERGEQDASREAGMCFELGTSYDLLSGGNKIMGSAQRRVRDGFLQQGTIVTEGLLRASIKRDELVAAIVRSALRRWSRKAFSQA